MLSADSQLPVLINIETTFEKSVTSLQMERGKDKIWRMVSVIAVSHSS